MLEKSLTLGPDDLGVATKEHKQSSLWPEKVTCLLEAQTWKLLMYSNCKVKWDTLSYYESVLSYFTLSPAGVNIITAAGG